MIIDQIKNQDDFYNFHFFISFCWRLGIHRQLNRLVIVYHLLIHGTDCFICKETYQSTVVTFTTGLPNQPNQVEDGSCWNPRLDKEGTAGAPKQCPGGCYTLAYALQVRNYGPFKHNIETITIERGCQRYFYF